MSFEWQDFLTLSLKQGDALKRQHDSAGQESAGQE